MRVPQVSERIKEAPAQALRGVFAGIGQLLLITDKLRNKAPFGQQVPYARAPEAAPTAAPRSAPAEPVANPAPADRDVAAEPGAGQTARTPSTPKTPGAPRTPKIPAAPKTPKSPPASEIRDFDKTGNVRLITGGEAYDDEPPAAPAQEPAPSTAEEPAPVAAPAPASVAAEPAEPSSMAAEEPPAAEEAADFAPPLPNYDQLSIASLRARLRNLDVPQLMGLLEYEKGHAGRADVIVMFERRIAKLETDD
jgi:hypothetical protein